MKLVGIALRARKPRSLHDDELRLLHPTLSAVRGHCVERRGGFSNFGLDA